MGWKVISRLEKIDKMEFIDKDKLKEFIVHWQLMITPYDETRPDHKAIKTVITELRTYIEVFTIPSDFTHLRPH